MSSVSPVTRLVTVKRFVHVPSSEPPFIENIYILYTGKLVNIVSYVSYSIVCQCILNYEFLFNYFLMKNGEEMRFAEDKT